MSESPEDDTASQAIERGKTRASQKLGETDEGQKQVKEKERGSGEEWSGRRRKPNTQKETQCPQIIKATWEQ